MIEFTEFLQILNEKAKGQIQGTAKLDVTDQCAIILSEEGARLGDEVADVTLSATQAVFEKILAGTQNPTMAFMSGQLKVDGSTTRALKVSAILTE
ncbi:sterol carrier family protein [Amylibacter marinus]|uniref:Sterol carrier family protein n=1 Tax=Amylibacter marinus TaxID=1475483 RepID=A0ABQ5VVR7_9RHOB|nr:SCP2 sterol-binding domain-containing protein [Amylibacter marinus]GLQ35394.1 sterol carrier family protein [Amylibacter marinus]